MPRRPLLVRFVAGTLAAVVPWAAGAVDARAAQPFPRDPRPYRILPAEFEPQDAVLLGWDRENLPIQQTLLEIIAVIGHRVQVVMLVRDAEDRRSVLEALQTVGLPPTAVRFLQMPYDTIWARDYGPTVVWTIDGRLEMVDADYERGERPRDDDVPVHMAPQFLLASVHAPLTIEGGNLLSNGVGLCVTTSTLVAQNAVRGYGEADVARLLRASYGATEVAFLEPLIGEPTGHVDMFCTFAAPDTVLIGQISPRDDPVNAALLDRNAERLAGLATPQGPLRVVRIPMPPCDGGIWRTYTNVLYANGVVVVPTYAGTDPETEAAALAVYRRVLPDWRVVGIDSTSLIALGGAVHCVSLNLSRIGRLPEEGSAPPGDGFLPPRLIVHPDRPTIPDGADWQPADERDGMRFQSPPSGDGRSKFLPPQIHRNPPMFSTDDTSPSDTMPTAFPRD